MKWYQSQRGQGVVEYGLILILSILAAGVIFQANNSTKNVMVGSSKQIVSQNPTNLTIPTVPTPETAWDNRIVERSPDYTFKPVAFFSVPNPIFVGETVTYWDGSYDPDGTIVDRKWTGKQNVFTSPGEYVVSLTVTDDDNFTDTYTITVKVVERQTYTRLVYDHANAIKQETSRSAIRNSGSANTLIIDHVFGKRTDLYNVQHVVIEQNLNKTTQLREQTVYYNVTIPVYQVTYSGSGQELRREPYIVDGKPYTVQQTQEQVVPQPANITTTLTDNRWTFYVYESISSVNNMYSTFGSTSYGSRSGGADYSRFAPDNEINDMPVKVRQDPTFESSRDTVKLSSMNTGYTSPTTPCKTCTEPNRYTARSVMQYDSRAVSCSGNGLSINTTNVTHNRIYNWIDHETYDHINKYTGTGKSTGTSSETKLQRNTWSTTNGWEAAELVGTAGAGTESTGTTRPKYTSCSGSGESCWNPITSTSQTKSSCEKYGSTTHSYSTGCAYGPSTGTDHYDKYRKRVLDCSWLGTSNTGASGSYEECAEQFVKRDPVTCNPPPPPPAPAGG